MDNRKRTKILIMVSLILALTLIIAGVFYISFRETGRDNLVPLVPADARAYVRFTYNPIRQSDTQKKFFQYLFFDLGRYLDEDNLSAVLACAPKEAGLVISKDNELAVILRIKNNCAATKSLAKSESLIINKNYLIISKSKNFLQWFAAAKYWQNNLASAYPWSKKINNREIFARIFALPTALPDLVSDQAKKMILSNFLVGQDVDYFFLEVDNNFNFVIKAPNNLKLPNNFLVDELPAGTILSLVLDGPRDNLAGLIEAVPVWFKQDLSNLLGTAMQAVIVSYDQTKEISWQNPEYILVGSPESFSRAGVEALTKKILAYQIPRKQAMDLPDKTKANELIVDPTQFVFNKVTVESEEINYISEPRIDFELAYGIKNGKFVLSNSIMALKNYFSGINDQKIGAACSVSGREKLVLDSAFWLGLEKYDEIFQRIIMVDNNFGCLR